MNDTSDRRLREIERRVVNLEQRTTAAEGLFQKFKQRWNGIRFVGRIPGHEVDDEECKDGNYDCKWIFAVYGYCNLPLNIVSAEFTVKDLYDPGYSETYIFNDFHVRPYFFIPKSPSQSGVVHYTVVTNLGTISGVTNPFICNNCKPAATQSFYIPKPPDAVCNSCCPRPLPPTLYATFDNGLTVRFEETAPGSRKYYGCVSRKAKRVKYKYIISYQNNTIEESGIFNNIIDIMAFHGGSIELITRTETIDTVCRFYIDLNNCYGYRSSLYLVAEGTHKQGLEVSISISHPKLKCGYTRLRERHHYPDPQMTYYKKFTRGIREYEFYGLNYIDVAPVDFSDFDGDPNQPNIPKYQFNYRPFIFPQDCPVYVAFEGYSLGRRYFVPPSTLLNNCEPVPDPDWEELHYPLSLLSYAQPLLIRSCELNNGNFSFFEIFDSGESELNYQCSPEACESYVEPPELSPPFYYPTTTTQNLYPSPAPFCRPSEGILTP